MMNGRQVRLAAVLARATVWSLAELAERIVTVTTTSASPLVK